MYTFKFYVYIFHILHIICMIYNYRVYKYIVYIHIYVTLHIPGTLKKHFSCVNI